MGPQPLDSQLPKVNDPLQRIVTLATDPENRSLQFDIPAPLEVTPRIDMMPRHVFARAALGTAWRALLRREIFAATDTYSSVKGLAASTADRQHSSVPQS